MKSLLILWKFFVAIECGGGSCLCWVDAVDVDDFDLDCFVEADVEVDLVRIGPSF